MKQVVLVRKWAQSACVVVPSEARKQLGWNVGDLVQIDVQGDTMVVQPVTLPKSRALSPAAESVNGGGEL
jgi:antitoxin component of MazEF toxin-antitoxin module